MLTTANSRNIEANVVTDINANVTSSQPAQRAVLSPEAAILFNKSIVARPLMVPEVCSIRVKNTEYQYRWVNKAGRNGAMYMQRRAQGFTNATTDDVDIMAGDSVATNGEITAGDVILMKIRKDLYDSAMKWNMEKANLLQRSRGMYLKNASNDVNSDSVAVKVSIAQENFAKTGKADTFIPDNPEALIANAAKSIAAAREQTNEIRENIAKTKTVKAED